jgi:hypothetical protein
MCHIALTSILSHKARKKWGIDIRRQTSDISREEKKKNITNLTKEKEKGIFITFISRIRARCIVPLQLQFTIYKNNLVIANEVKQSHKSKIRLLRRSTSLYDIDVFSETGLYVYSLY